MSMRFLLSIRNKFQFYLETANRATEVEEKVTNVGTLGAVALGSYLYIYCYILYIFRRHHPPHFLTFFHPFAGTFDENHQFSPFFCFFLTTARFSGVIKLTAHCFGRKKALFDPFFQSQRGFHSKTKTKFRWKQTEIFVHMKKRHFHKFFL